jgi:hypothetical protein
MRHHQTRRKGRSLKKQNRSTRRKQQGGAAIGSIDDWFKAISDFEARKGELGPYYSFASLSDQELKLPSSVSEDDESKYMIRDVNLFYPPLSPPLDYKTPDPVDISLIHIAHMVTYLFNGEYIGEGLQLNQGLTNLSAFLQYVKNIRTIPDNTGETTGYENKRTVWFLNEIESALHRTSGIDRGFTTIYDRPKLPFYIMYLIANPVVLSTIPDLEPLPSDILNQLSSPLPTTPSTQPEPVVQAVL